ncbi:MAG: hypothetical protein K6T80_00165 [Firmicutes bacterium]|nr:hypothetical protein [Bacillota bacterium]
MRLFRTVAGVGAAALAFVALSRISRRVCADETAGDCLKKAAGRVQGVIRRRTVFEDESMTNDVI